MTVGGLNVRFVGGSRWWGIITGEGSAKWRATSNGDNGGDDEAACNTLGPWLGNNDNGDSCVHDEAAGNMLDQRLGYDDGGDGYNDDWWYGWQRCDLFLAFVDESCIQYD